jgi:uncharacterized protein
VHLTWTSLPRNPSRCILEQLQRSAERLVITSVAATYGLPLPAGLRQGATVVVAPDGRIVVYSGDDERFDYMYKFVSTGSFDPHRRKANFGLLDDGTLYIAKFNDDGTGEWRPLVFGQEPLTPANDFAPQAEVLINARGAADRLGATKMDRPENIETNPATARFAA